MSLSALGRNDHRWLVTAVAIFAMLFFIGLSILQDGPGFPLDDGWIHQTYARNLARTGHWEYTPGVTSSGSTAPLWTLLLTVGYLLKLPYLLWAYLLGLLGLIWSGWMGMALWRILWPNLASKDWLAGILLVLTWPLLWAAASGMETTLFIALGLTILVLYTQVVLDEKHSVENHAPRLSYRLLSLVGVLSGFLVLTRPDGVVLVALVLAGILLLRKPFIDRLVGVGVLTAAAALPLIPYFAFNLLVSGSVWPNTLYAKQTEYAFVLAQPIWERVVRLLYFSLGGPETGWRGMSAAHLLLLPGLIAAAWRSLQADWLRRRLLMLLPLLWAGGHVVLYAWRLPVTYQHGRYLMAAMPIWVLYGLAGWLFLMGRAGDGRWARLGNQVLAITFVVLVFFFLLLGGQAYANDVAFIQGEMVDVALWLAENTPPDALIAAHDIGAIGYFAERPLLDLAGLISPETIPLLNDNLQLTQYILSGKADYLVTAPGWPYETVTHSEQATLIYGTNYSWTVDQGLNNMEVYRLRTP